MYRKTAILGLCSALAILLGYVESLIPFLPSVYGIKLGLSNLMIVFMLYLYGSLEAFVVSMIRIIVIGFLFGNLFSILFSLAGALASLLVMSAVKKIQSMGVIGVSLTGGVAHNMAQMGVAWFLVSRIQLLYYLPVLMAAGVITGIIIGLVSREKLRRLCPLLEKEKWKEI